MGPGDRSGRPAGGGRAALGLGAHGTLARAHRRDRGRAHHFPARDRGGRAQLRLPVLLDPGREPDRARDGGPRVRGRGGPLSQLHAAYRGGERGRPPSVLRRGGGAGGGGERAPGGGAPPGEGRGAREISPAAASTWRLLRSAVTYPGPGPSP